MAPIYLCIAAIQTGHPLPTSLLGVGPGLRFRSFVSRPAGLMVRRGSVWKVRGKFIKNKQAKVRGAAGMAYTQTLLFVQKYLLYLLVNAKWVSLINFIYISVCIQL